MRFDLAGVDQIWDVSWVNPWSIADVAVSECVLQRGHSEWELETQNTVDINHAF